MKTPSMRQVAKEAGVSVATVSNLLSGKNSNIRVSESTRQRVLKACNQIGYEPNIHAQRLFSRRSMTLSIIFPPLEQHLRVKHAPDLNLAGVMQGVSSVASKKGYQIVLNPAETEFFRKKQYLRLFRSRAVDAMIIWGIGLDDLYVDELAQQGIPFVMVQTIVGHATEAGYPYVIANSELGACQLAEHLLSLGHRNIGCIRGLQTSSVGVARWIGFRETMIKHGIFRQDLVYDGDYTFETGILAAKELLNRCPQITALACANELMAAGAIEYVRNQGLRVPEDISISGYDGVHSVLIQPLTTCNDPNYDMGGIAAEHLINFIDNRSKETKLPDFQIVLDPELRIGVTTGPPPQH